MDLNSLYQQMFEAVVSGGPQKILNAAYQVIKLPIIAVDTSYNVLAVKDSESVKDYIFNSLAKEGRASTELVWLFHKEKYIESVCKSSKPVYLNWGSLEIPQISGAIRVNGIIRGYIGVVCPESEFREELIDASDIIANALALDMKNHKIENAQNNPLLELFIRDLLTGIFQNEEQLDTWKSNFPHIFKRDYMLAAVLPPADGEIEILQYFSSMISSRFPNVLSTILSDTLFLLFYGLKNEAIVDEINKAIEKQLSSFDTIYSVSKSFPDILNAPNYGFQVKKALEIGPKLHLGQVVYRYEDYVIPTIFSYSLKEMDSLSYVHHIINQLKDFDKKNNTDYLVTLETYIMCFCSSRRVIEKLHIHRNTLLYRLNKISELTSCDFEDENTCTQLMLSFQMLKLKSLIV